jgi:transposase InsO family protein
MKSKTLTDWCRQINIKHYFTTPYHHQSNVRIERFNRTLQEGLNKTKEIMILKERIDKVVEVYNNVKHEAI